MATSFYTDDDINDLLNEAQEVFASDDGVIEADSGISLVANQYLYSPPSDFISPRLLVLDEKSKLQYVSMRELLVYLNGQPNAQGDPEFYTLWDNFIRVWPTPTVSADTTTLSAGVGATDTTIPVNSTSGFPKTGHIKIDSEEIRYYDADATSFKQAVRGVGGTTAASHMLGATVTEQNLRLFYYKSPTAMSVDTDSPDVPERYHRALVYYAAGMLKIKNGQYDQGQFLLSLFEQKKAQAISEIKRRQRDRNPKILPGDMNFVRTAWGIP